MMKNTIAQNVEPGSVEMASGYMMNTSPGPVRKHTHPQPHAHIHTQTHTHKYAHIEADTHTQKQMYIL